MRWTDPIDRGSAGSLLSVLAAAILAAPFVHGLHPSPEFLRTAAGVGASLFLAYVVEANWMAAKVPASKFGEVFLGALTGFAIAGFFGVVALLLLSEQDFQNPTWLSRFGLCWSGISLVLLGFSIAMQPVVVHAWKAPAATDE